MKDKKLIESIERSINQAPIDILEDIKNEPRTKMLRHDNITRQEPKASTIKKFMPYVSLVAALVLVVFGWQYQNKLPDSLIYFDVNPSIEITTNRQNKVIDIEADNLDGKVIADKLDYEGVPVDELVEELLDRMIKERYLYEDDNFLLLSVYNKDKEKSESKKVELDRKIHKYLQSKKFEPIILSQNIDKTSTIENYAREFDVSISKMTFIKNLIILNPELKTEALVKLSIGDLVRLSQDTGLELDKIIDSIDFNKIDDLKLDGEEEDEVEGEIEEKTVEKIEKKLEEKKEVKKIEKKPVEKRPDSIKEDNDDDDDDDETQKSNIISAEQARKIALSIAKGKITDFDFDSDDLEYEVEIEVGDLEYEIKIDARTGAVIEVEVDD